MRRHCVININWISRGKGELPSRYNNFTWNKFLNCHKHTCTSNKLFWHQNLVSCYNSCCGCWKFFFILSIELFWQIRQSCIILTPKAKYNKFTSSGYWAKKFGAFWKSFNDGRPTVLTWHVLASGSLNWFWTIYPPLDSLDLDVSARIKIA